jgi:hypothetical protein
MDQSDCATDGIAKINRAAIGDVDSKTNTGLVRHDSIAILKAIVCSSRRSNHADLFSVNLLRRHEWDRGKTVAASYFPMNAVEPRERFRLVMGHGEAGHTECEAMHEIGRCLEGGIMLSRKLGFAHLGLTVVRVVVVVVRLGIGGRLPA